MEAIGKLRRRQRVKSESISSIARNLKLSRKVLLLCIQTHVLAKRFHDLLSLDYGSALDFPTSKA